MYALHSTLRPTKRTKINIIRQTIPDMTNIDKISIQTIFSIQWSCDSFKQTFSCWWQDIAWSCMHLYCGVSL